MADVDLHDVDYAVLIERFADYPDEEALFAEVKKSWPSAFEVRREERLRGVSHFMSPKVWIGRFGFTMYHSAACPYMLDFTGTTRFVHCRVSARFTPRSWGSAKCSNAARKMYRRSISRN